MKTKTLAPIAATSFFAWNKAMAKRYSRKREIAAKERKLEDG